MTTIASQLLAYLTGSLRNANPAVQALDSTIKPLLPGVRSAGPAKTARAAVFVFGLATLWCPMMMVWWCRGLLQEQSRIKQNR